MPRYRMTRHARNDVRAIGRYVSQFNQPAALRLYDAFEKTFRMLSRQPLLGELAPDLGERMRSFPTGNYVIYYEPTPGGVRIIRVIHGARDQERAFDAPE